MSKRINYSLLAIVIGLAVFVLAGKQSEQVATASPATGFDLLNALPASDFIVYVDTQRVLMDVIPGMLVEQPEARAKLESEIEKLKKEAGFDPRLVDQIAVGVNFNSQSAPGGGFAIIARGRFDAGATIDAGLTLASKESKGYLVKDTQEYGGKTLFLLVPAKRDVVDPGETKETEYKPGDHVMVFVALDSSTVAFGNLKSVRATIDASLGRGRVDDELVRLASRTPNAVVGFSGKVPPDFSRNFRLGSKEVDAGIGAVELVYGSLNINGTDADGLVNVRMDAPEDARRVSMALNALKFISKIGGAETSAERKAIEAIVKNVEVYVVGNEVQIAAKVALTDLAPFIPKD